MILKLTYILNELYCEKSTSLTHVADGTWRYTISPAIEAVGADWKHKDKKKYKIKTTEVFQLQNIRVYKNEKKWSLREQTFTRVRV